MKGPKNEYELIQQLDILADNLKTIPLCDGYELTVKVAIKLIEKLTTDAWHDAFMEKPQLGGTYLCVVIYPDNRGGFVEAQRVLHFDKENDWSCNDMIVTHWRDKPAFPVGGALPHG